ncbi:MAG: bifunctional oligoribonuclease/PAP phosphatase NrnA [Erysipelotrichales bacterium]|nr:MAG: bifunctional oligoribonuclease/PAP phosphatase NrnA [Erysipelotrichales bacterium]
MQRTLRTWLEEAQTICVFRHQNPDPDALGSQWGLITWLKETYPHKNIYAMGKHLGVKPELFETPDEVENSIIEESLAIVLDTANAARVDDQRFIKALNILKIDHHPTPDHYAKLEIVHEDAASTSEIIAQLLKSYSHDAVLSTKTAQYLYMGIISDTMKFSTNNTTPHTLKMAAYLAQSHLDLPRINEELFAVSMDEYKFINYIRAHATIEEGGLVTIFLTLETLKTLGISANQAKERINELGNVRGFEIWAMFIQTMDEDAFNYNGSLRSRRVTINDIAARYGGGGHKHAAAIKSVDEATALLLLDELRARIKGEL